jgi:pimeloyl-ACP methyl ester carboxylesterase
MGGGEQVRMRQAIDPATSGRREHRLPPTESRNAPLSIQEVSPTDGNVQPTPIILLHGATFSSAMFDIPVLGYSLQTFLAAKGWRNFAVDVRGYGRSVPSAALEAPPESNQPNARFHDAVEDLATSVRYVLDQAGCKSMHIVGFSWGTIAAGIFAAQHPQLVESLVVYAPVYAEVNKPWIDRLADPNDRTRVDPRLGAYRWVDLQDIYSRWDADIPAGANVEDYREERVLRATFESLIKADPRTKERQHTSFRVPTGALHDLFEIFNGRALYDPSRITVPTLVIRGQDDTTSTESDALGLFHSLATASKRYVAISPGSHFLCAERNAGHLFGEIELFLGRGACRRARGVGQAES